MLSVGNYVLATGWVWTCRPFHGSAGVVFEVLVDAAGRYDAPAYAAESSSCQSGPIAVQVAGYILVEILIPATKREIVHALSIDIWICGHASLILVDWVEARPTPRHRKQADRLALGYLIIHVRYA